LFPLDKECNWMVSESLHPGSCAVSEAVLCAGPDGELLFRPVPEAIHAYGRRLLGPEDASLAPKRRAGW
jgi:hypothetical protein